MRLLVLLLGLLVLSPLFEEFFKLRLLGDLFFTAIFIYASYSFSRSKALAAAAVSLAVPTMVSFWIKPFFNAASGWKFPAGFAAWRSWLSSSPPFCTTFFCSKT